MASSNDAQLKWLSQCEEDVVQDDLTQLISETRGVMEKLAVSATPLRRGLGRDDLTVAPSFANPRRTADACALVAG